MLSWIKTAKQPSYHRRCFINLRSTPPPAHKLLERTGSIRGQRGRMMRTSKELGVHMQLQSKINTDNLLAWLLRFIKLPRLITLDFTWLIKLPWKHPDSPGELNSESAEECNTALMV